MEPIAEGVTRYDQSAFAFVPPLPRAEYSALNRYRETLHRAGLVGAYPDGLGYGNVSQRRDYSRLQQTLRPQFLISGTQTGHLAELDGRHYVRVVDFDVDRFAIAAQGPLRASSEAVTHGAVYDLNPAIRAVFHVHDRPLWQALATADGPATPRWVPYGSRELALAMRESVAGATQGLIVMKGHEEGLIAFGPSLAAALGQIAAACRRVVSRRLVFR